MKRILAVCLLLLAGCVVQSFGPFCTDNSVVYVREAVGEWKLQKDFGDDVSTNLISLWVFAGDAATNCTLKAFDKENIGATFGVKFFKLGKSMFVDVLPTDPAEGTKLNSYWMWTERAMHTICKVELNGKVLTLIPLDFDWFKKQLQENALPYAGNVAAEFIVTANPKQWEVFLSKHAANPDAFREKHAFVLKRSSQ